MSDELPEHLQKALKKNQRDKQTRTRGASKLSVEGSLTDLEFVARLYKCSGSAYALSRELGISHRIVARRRERIENDLGIVLPRGRPEVWKSQEHRRVINVNIDNGTILIGSDLHCWPDIHGVAMAAFVDFNRRMKPDFVILNGDAHDGAMTSRHDRLGWDKRPMPAEEIAALADYFHAVRMANPNGKYLRTRGNHDPRLETYLASKAPLAEGIRGTALSDHLPGWEAAIAIWVNGRHLQIKHRGRHNGMHAIYNEVRRLSCHCVFGHLHSQKTIPYRNAAGQWYGVDLGMMAPMDHPAFDYAEHEITDWRSGFYVLTIRNGELMPPQEATVLDEDGGELYFAGQVLKYEL